MFKSTPAMFEAPPLTGDRPEVRYERKMGDSELAFYLPSRANGNYDM